MDLEDMQKQSVEVIQHLHHDAEQPQSSAEVGALGLSVYGANNCDVYGGDNGCSGGVGG